MKSRDWLELAAGTVAYILTMFGGFLTGFAPPPHPVRAEDGFALGLGSMLAAVLFLLVIAVVRLTGRRVKPAVWLGVAAALTVGFGIAGFAYHDFKRDHTFVWNAQDPPATYLAGDSLTSYATRLASAIQQQGQEPTSEGMVELSGGPSEAEQIWPRSSLARVQRKMELRYLLVLLAISGGLFFLLEGVLPLLPRSGSNQPD